MAVLPTVPTAACLFLSVLACWPAFVRAWKRPSAQVFAWGVVSRRPRFAPCGGLDVIGCCRCFVARVGQFQYSPSCDGSSPSSSSNNPALDSTATSKARSHRNLASGDACLPKHTIGCASRHCYCRQEDRGCLNPYLPNQCGQHLRHGVMPKLLS